MIVTMGDEKFYPYIERSVAQAGKLYPDEDMVIYNWGFTPQQVSRLRRFPNVLRVYKWHMVQTPFRKAKVNSHEWFLAQKPYCYRHFLTYHATTFLFIDGDAWLLDRVDELRDPEVDICVTVRPEKDQTFGFDECRVINSGVFWLNNPALIEAWITEMHNTRERLIEQTALTRLLYNDSTQFSFRAFPCEVYNHYWPDDPPPGTKVRHLKGRKAKRRFRQ